MMNIKNIGKHRIRLDRNLFILPGETQNVPIDIGQWAITVHTDIIKITPVIPKFKPKVPLKEKKKVKPKSRPIFYNSTLKKEIINKDEVK